MNFSPYGSPDVVATLHRTTLNRTTVKRRQFIGATGTGNRVPLHLATHHRAFELLAESQPTTVDQLDELTTFFEHTFSHLWCSHISRRSLESARCRVRRHSSQHQQRRGVAPRVTIQPCGVSWLGFGGTFSAIMRYFWGYDWSNAPVGKKISFTERSCCASSRSPWSRSSTCLSSYDCVFVALIHIWDCNWHVRIVYYIFFYFIHKLG